MRQLQPTGQTTAQDRRGARATAHVATSGRHGMRRGLIHGVILSLVAWLAAGYLTLILR